jgi:hypothetical protein
MLPRHGWSASASYSHAHVVQFGPITGGLFLEDDVLAIADGTRFIPDHDQRHALFATVSYARESRWRVSGAFRFQTGTPVGVDEEDLDQLAGRRGASVVDFESGRVHARATADVQADWTLFHGPRMDMALTGWVTNIGDQTYAFNFGNPFSGTHFGGPRRVGFSVRANVRGRANSP